MSDRKISNYCGSIDYSVSIAQLKRAMKRELDPQINELAERLEEVDGLTGCKDNLISDDELIAAAKSELKGWSASFNALKVGAIRRDIVLAASPELRAQKKMNELLEEKEGLERAKPVVAKLLKKSKGMGFAIDKAVRKAAEDLNGMLRRGTSPWLQLEELVFFNKDQQKKLVLEVPKYQQRLSFLSSSIDNHLAMVKKEIAEGRAAREARGAEPHPLPLPY